MNSPIETSIYEACVDCFTFTSGDASSFDYHYGEDANDRIVECGNGLGELLDLHPGDAHAVCGSLIAEFSNSGCECCGSGLAGRRLEIVVIYNPTAE